MAQLKILTFPNPVLKLVAEEVRDWNQDIIQLSKDMLETMYAAPGIGLAAPQVGMSIRLLVIDCRPRLEDGTVDFMSMTELEKKVPMPLILVNPKVKEKRGKAVFEEGCLSVPGFYENVSRAEWIEVSAKNEKGEDLNFEVDGLTAICIQHEIDHLDGKLFIDRLSVVKRGLIKSKIQKHGYPQRTTQKEHTL